MYFNNDKLERNFKVFLVEIIGFPIKSMHYNEERLEFFRYRFHGATLTRIKEKERKKQGDKQREKEKMLIQNLYICQLKFIPCQNPWISSRTHA